MNSAKVLSEFEGPHVKELLLLSKAPSSNMVLVFMSPEAFLRLVSRKNFPCVGKIDHIETFRSRGEKYRTLPKLWVRASRVVRHNGRHRALRLREEGFDMMPVILVSADERPPSLPLLPETECCS